MGLGFFTLLGSFPMLSYGLHLQQHPVTHIPTTHFQFFSFFTVPASRPTVVSQEANMMECLIFAPGWSSQAVLQLGVAMTGVSCSPLIFVLVNIRSLTHHLRIDIWGFADVEAGIKAIPHWMKDTNWNGQGIDLHKWVITGHSNGGIFAKSSYLIDTVTN